MQLNRLFLSQRFFLEVFKLKSYYLNILGKLRVTQFCKVTRRRVVWRIDVNDDLIVDYLKKC